MSLKYASLSALAAAIATERARPGAYRTRLAAIESTAAAKLEQFEREPLGADIDQVLAAQGLRLAAGATLESFDRIAVENRELALLDGFCRENCEEIAGLLDAERIARMKPSKSYFQTMADRFATSARKFFGTGHSQDELSAASLESQKIQAESDRKTYELATSESAIVRFKNGPCWEFLNEASVAVNALDFSV